MFPDFVYFDDQGNATTDIKWFYVEQWIMNKHNPGIGYDNLLNMDLIEYRIFQEMTYKEIEKQNNNERNIQQALK